MENKEAKLFASGQDRLIRERERQAITSISRSHAHRLEKEGKFPERIRLGSRSVAWRLSEINAWLDDLKK
ncbi:AlpA family phage regulatory protein [Photobacterium leiognathi]|uniref:AlpA family phage regulatory protein n=1 Tax=Photobacterium leiognathi TaxID=553611 RepID=UPI002981ABF5|nr:AlpA family phage regulatory protein [Photobacterium leiognathi]